MDYTQLIQAVDTLIEAQAFSGVIEIRHRNTQIYANAAGYADRSNQIKNTLETRFGVASGTKFFTALAIGKLIAANRLSFDTRLQDCVALDFPRYSPEITIGHLLSHTSGIPDYYDESKISDFDTFTINTPWYEVRGPRDYLASFPDEEMQFRPGERFAYSNSGYILLGLVIEELTGERYQDVVEQQIFRPIGMQRSGFFAMNKLPAQTAFGYIEEADGWRTNIYNLPIIGASDGGAYTTLADIATLWQAFWGYQILPQALVDAYTQPQIVDESANPPRYYGRGLWLCDDEYGRPEEYITGADAGVSFKSRVSRTRELLVTVISNTSHGAWPMLRSIDRALGDAQIR